MSDLTTEWDDESETYVNNQYGDYSLETVATIRDHFLYMLTEDNGVFRGQCSNGDNCETVTWIAVIRWYDGSYHLVESGQYVR